MTTRSALLLVTVTVLLLSGHTHSQSALPICRCAAVFPTDTDIDQASSDNQFNTTDEGETRVFTSMRFFCHTTLISVNYSSWLLDDCQDSTTLMLAQYPEIQLWRANGTFYHLERRKSLSPYTNTLTLGWKVENMDLIGVWFPPSTRECLRIGYTPDKTSHYYQLERGVDTSFNVFDYRPIEGPMPLIAVTINMELDLICLIALPVGFILTILCCSTVCCAVIYSIKRERDNKRHAKGGLTITHTSPTFIDEDDVLEMRSRPRRGGGSGGGGGGGSREETNPYDTIQETAMVPPLPPRNPGRNRFTSTSSITSGGDGANRPTSSSSIPPQGGRPPSTVPDLPAPAGGIHRANRPPDLDLHNNGPPLPRSFTGPIPPTTPPSGMGYSPSSGTLPPNMPPQQFQPPVPPPPPPPQATEPTSPYVNVEPHPQAPPTSQPEDEYVNVEPPQSHLHQNMPPSEGSSAESTPPVSPVADPVPLQLEHNPHFDEFDDVDLPEDEYVIPSDLQQPHSGGYANMTDHRNSTLY